MDAEQANLGSNLGSFLSFAQMQGIDYQIAVATTDVFDTSNRAGCFVGNPKIISIATLNGNNAFNNTVVSLGIGGWSDEQGLEAAYFALSDPLINTVNAGF